MSARRALVSGASGFIGASLTRRLLGEGHEVHALLRPESDNWRLQDILGEVEVYEVDLRDRDAVDSAVKGARADWVFHLAAHGGYSWQEDARSIYESNVFGTLNLAHACVMSGFEAFVHAGSSSEYGFKDHAPSEDEAPEPNSDYAVAKVTATLICRHLAAQQGLRLTTLRLYSVYGPWEDPRRLMPTLVMNALEGRWPPLVDPATARDFVHVEDVCDAFLLATSAPISSSSAIYNVGSGKQTRLSELVELATRLFSVGVAPEWASHEARRWDAKLWIADPEKIMRELGWRPRRDLESGLSELARWIAQLPAPRTRYSLRG